ERAAPDSGSAAETRLPRFHSGGWRGSDQGFRSIRGADSGGAARRDPAEARFARGLRTRARKKTSRALCFYERLQRGIYQYKVRARSELPVPAEALHGGQARVDAAHRRRAAVIVLEPRLLES